MKTIPFKHQQEAFDLSKDKESFALFMDLGCVDSDTEYLSSTGWRRIGSYAGGDVAQYHPDTKQISYVGNPEFVQLPCESMVRIKTKYGIDQLLSPEHRVLLEDRHGAGKKEVVTAAELLSRHDAWIRGDVWPRPFACKLGSDTIAYSGACIPSSFRAIGGPGIPLTDACLRLQVAVIADGSFPLRKKTPEFCVVRIKKDRKKTRLRHLLLASDTPYREKEQGAGYSSFYFKAPLRAKVFDETFWACTYEQLLVITDEVMHWDGSISSNTNRGSIFTTLKKESADFVQYAFSGTGRTARLSARFREKRGFTEYSVLVRNNGRPLAIKSVSSSGRRRAVMSYVPSTDGYKYCFMVPSTFLVLRRNGCVFLSGNTGKSKVAIDTICHLYQAHKIVCALIIAPKGVVPAWYSEGDWFSGQLVEHMWPDLPHQIAVWTP
ncbi:MAG: hypothetical protein L0Y56_05765, partial [Nitrospira sp.]|nr:hypothetical protein [Nitrospira sp.]